VSPGTGKKMGDFATCACRLLRRSVYACMKIRKEGVAVWRLDENRYAVAVDHVVRYVGSREECQRRAEILMPKADRDMQDQALLRACGV
jgi:hypothetical protein